MPFQERGTTFSSHSLGDRVRLTLRGRGVVRGQHFVCLDKALSLPSTILHTVRQSERRVMTLHGRCRPEKSYKASVTVTHLGLYKLAPVTSACDRVPRMADALRCGARPEARPSVSGSNTFRKKTSWDQPSCLTSKGSPIKKQRSQSPELPSPP